MSSEVFISLLRGINVSGQKQIKMTDLKALYESLGFIDVKTYIQSGNVIFQSAEIENPELLVRKIENAIQEKFGFDVPVIIRTKTELQRIIESNPILAFKENDEDRLYVTFLEKLPDKTAIEKLSEFDFSPDKFVLIEKEIFIFCPNGYGKTKINNTFFESKLKLKATTRNWKTVNTLAKM